VSPMLSNTKDLTGIRELNRDDIELILETAESLKEVSGREIKKVPALRGRTVVNLFLEPSTRTRTSFELAAKRLSADVINFSASTSSIVKGEYDDYNVKPKAFHYFLLLVFLVLLFLFQILPENIRQFRNVITGHSGHRF